MSKLNAKIRRRILTEDGCDKDLRSWSAGLSSRRFSSYLPRIFDDTLLFEHPSKSSESQARFLLVYFLAVISCKWLQYFGDIIHLIPKWPPF